MHEVAENLLFPSVVYFLYASATSIFLVRYLLYFEEKKLLIWEKYHLHYKKHRIHQATIDNVALK